MWIAYIISIAFSSDLVCLCRTVDCVDVNKFHMWLCFDRTNVIYVDVNWFFDVDLFGKCIFYCLIWVRDFVKCSQNIFLEKGYKGGFFPPLKNGLLDF